MKRDSSAKRKSVLSISLIIGVILAAAAGTLAIYTSQVFQRSVVRNRDNEIIRFSSDKLYRVTPGTDAQKYYYPMSEGQKTMTFQVCNYDQAKNTLFNEQRIDYTVTFQVINGTDGFSYEISDGNTTESVTTENSVTFTGSLRGKRRSSNAYSFTFDEGDYNTVELHVTVTPSDLTTTQNRILNGVLIPVEYATTQGVTVKDEFADSTRGTPDQFDAYNLLVSISGGSGNVLITWDSTKLDIDPFFREGKNVKQNGETSSTITVPMNSDDETGTYLITFYNHTVIEPGWKEWKELPISVELENTPEK